MNGFMNKYKLHLIIVLLVIFNICIVIKNQEHYFLAQYTSSTNNNENKIELSQKDNYKIKVYYPETKYSKLDNTIDKKIEKIVSEFKSEAANNQIFPNLISDLIITYDKYVYNNYISYVFFIEYFTGGAHPNHEIWTITYDIKNDSIITIDDLIKDNSEFLKKVSDYTRSELLHNPGITDIQMLIDGTRPDKDNFSNFAFTNDGYLVFFPHYQVAPYSSGSFVVKIPYSEIFNKNG